MNILIIYNVNTDFINAMYELANEKIIILKRVDVELFFFDGAPVYDLPIANKNMHYKILHWDPRMICRGINFNKVINK